MSIAQSFKNRQIIQRKYSVKILSSVPECSYFPYFFENIDNKIPYECNQYSIIIKNKQNLKQISVEESQRVKSEIDEITQLYKKFDMEIPPIIQKGLSDVSQIFDKKGDKPHVARSCKFAPFSNQSSLRNSEEAKAVLLRFFNVEAANKLNNTRIKKINQYDSEIITPTTKLAKEGVYIPPALNFDIGTLMLQTFVEVYDDETIDESIENNFPKEKHIIIANPQDNLQKSDSHKKSKSSKSKKNKKKKKSSKRKNSNDNAENVENDQQNIADAENFNNDNEIKDVESSFESPNPLRNDDEIADDEEIRRTDDDFIGTGNNEGEIENNENEILNNGDEIPINGEGLEKNEGEIQNEGGENENQILLDNVEGDFANTEIPDENQDIQFEDNQAAGVENDPINNEEGENNENMPFNGNEVGNEEDLSDPFEIPFCEENTPDEEYMNCSYTEKLVFELESLGFTLPSNRNILVANAFCVVNGIDPKEIDQKVERANKAKEFLHDFTIDHLPQIEEHNQRVAMNEFLSQSLS